jgi:hypothetical protein
MDLYVGNVSISHVLPRTFRTVYVVHGNNDSCCNPSLALSRTACLSLSNAPAVDANSKDAVRATTTYLTTYSTIQVHAQVQVHRCSELPGVTRALLHGSCSPASLKVVPGDAVRGPARRYLWDSGPRAPGARKTDKTKKKRTGP